MNVSDPHPRRLSLDSSDFESNARNSTTSDEGTPQVSYRNTCSNSLTPFLKFHQWRPRFTNLIMKFPMARITPSWRRFLIIFGVLCYIGLIAGMQAIILKSSVNRRGHCQAPPYDSHPVSCHRMSYYLFLLPIHYLSPTEWQYRPGGN